MPKANNLIKRAKIPVHETESVLVHILGLSRTEIYLDNPGLSLMDNIRFVRIIKRRLSGEPLQYILGEVEFFGLPFKVDKNVFIPRPETEILMEKVLAKFKDKQNLKILDLCTGSGNVAVSMAKNLDCIVTATDISAKSIALAKNNSQLNGVENKIIFVISDLFRNIRGKFDIITINPPYIPTNEIASLNKEISFEPVIALDGGKDGLDYYFEIFKKAPEFLRDSGSIFVEIGDNQVEKLQEMLSGHKDLRLQNIFNDYNQRSRVLEIARI